MDRRILLFFACLLLNGGAKAMDKKVETAIFAGGCFWCMTPPFEKLNGVTSVLSGYIGGAGAAPTYEDYAAKGHIEAVEITYDPSMITYDKLLDVLWQQIDPTDPGGEFADRGPQYRSVIFYHNEEQKKLAEASKKKLAASGRFKKPIVTEILPATQFYGAEDYHQDYHKKNPIRYKYYRSGSGRDEFLKKTWGSGGEE
jgi:methionine-S-sulfoxide reductase